jgi:hypothetical protein
VKLLKLIDYYLKKNKELNIDEDYFTLSRSKIYFLYVTFFWRAYVRPFYISPFSPPFKIKYNVFRERV